MTAPAPALAAARRLYTPAEAAAALGRDTGVLTKWANAHLLGPGTVIRIPGGHRRYDADVIDAIAAGKPPDGAAAWLMRPEEWMRPAEVTARLGIDRKQLITMRRKGIIPAAHVSAPPGSRQCRYRRAFIEGYAS